jgi:hypothetical protein
MMIVMKVVVVRSNHGMIFMLMYVMDVMRLLLLVLRVARDAMLFAQWFAPLFLGDFLIAWKIVIMTVLLPAIRI